MSIDLLPAFLLGFLGSAHCLGMCGGINAMLLGAGSKESSIAYGLNYHLGRMSSYMLMGLLIASLGSQVQKLPLPDVDLPRLLAGILVISMGFYCLKKKSILLWLEAQGRRFWGVVQPLTRRLLPLENKRQAFLLGACWGWLPCGLVYGALGLAATRTNSMDGALMMLAFGLGTLPALLASSAVLTALKSWITKGWVVYLLAGFYFSYGSWSIYSALVPHHDHASHSAHHHHHHH